MRRLLALGVEVGAHPDPAPHPKTSPHLDPNPNPNPDPNPDPNPNLSPNPNPNQVGAVQRLDAELGGPRAVRIMRAGCRQRGATLKHALQKITLIRTLTLALALALALALTLTQAFAAEDAAPQGAG